MTCSESEGGLHCSSQQQVLQICQFGAREGEGEHAVSESDIGFRPTTLTSYESKAMCITSAATILRQAYILLHNWNFDIESNTIYLPWNPGNKKKMFDHFVSGLCGYNICAP